MSAENIKFRREQIRSLLFGFKASNEATWEEEFGQFLSEEFDETIKTLTTLEISGGNLEQQDNLILKGFICAAGLVTYGRKDAIHFLLRHNLKIGRVQELRKIVLEFLPIPTKVLDQEGWQPIKTWFKQNEPFIEWDGNSTSFFLSPKKQKKVVYRSKKLNTYYLIPENIELKDGSFAIYSHLDMKKNVERKSIEFYKISQKKAREYLFNELNHSMNRFLNIIKSEIDPSESHIIEKMDFLNREHISKKIKEGGGFLKDMTDALKVMWTTAKSEDVTKAKESQEKMRAIRERMEARGIKVDDSFENIPQKLREQYLKKETNINFQESALKFEKELSKLKTEFQRIFSKKKNDND